MAGDWIKIEHVTPDKPEIDQLANILGIDHDAVTGKLIRLWVWADQQSLNGYAQSVTHSGLDRITFCPGFAKALEQVGWLESEEGQIRFPNFDFHNGKTAKQRALANKRKAESRAKRDKCHDYSVTNEGNERDETVDQRREEKIITERVVTREDAPTESECEKFAQTSVPPQSADFAVSVAREFYALYAGQDWRKVTGEDILPKQKWKYVLKMRLEAELRQENERNKRYQSGKVSGGNGRAKGHGQPRANGGDDPGAGINVPFL